MTLTEIFTDIANAIRSKNKSTAKIQPINFAQEIENISSGGGMNIFMQETEPEVKEGIWLQKEGSFEKVVVTDVVSSEPYWETAPATIPYNFYRSSAVAIGTDIYLFGTYEASCQSYAYKYNTLTNTFTKLTDIPYSFYQGSAVAIGTDIYLLGSYISEYQKTVYKYDTLTNSYTQINNTPKACHNALAVAIGTDIYLLGGTTNTEQSYKYNTLTGSYSAIATTPYGFYQGAGVVVGTDIYLFGTYNDEQRKYAYKYDTLTNSYAQLTNIPYDFYNGSAVAIGNDIYLTGNGVSGYQNFHYKYNTLTNTYTKLTNIPYNFSRGTSVLVKNKIYLLGGVDSKTRIETYIIPVAGDYPTSSIVIFNGTTYTTQILSSPDNVEGRVLTGITDVSYNTENGLDDTIPTYYGSGTEWIKFKN